jgi:hypothetical protein
MNYEELKAAELKALCEERGIKPNKAKAVMAADLKAKDEADELLRQQNMTKFEDDLLASVVEGPVRKVSPTFGKALEEPVQAPEYVPVPFIPEEVVEAAEASAAASGGNWVEDGVYLRAFERRDVLDQGEHTYYLRKVEEHANEAGFTTFGTPFRVAPRTTDSSWVYGINVR